MGYARIGVVFRDHVGQIISALSQRIPLIHSMELAEAMATRHAILFAKELSLFNAKIERDCSRVITILDEMGRSSTLFGHITDECKRLGVAFRFCKFKHVRREGNRLAHSLARRAILFADMNVWVESIPSDLDVVFQSDLFQ